MVVNAAVVEGHTGQAGIQLAPTEELICEPRKLWFAFDNVDLDISRSTKISHFLRGTRIIFPRVKNYHWQEILIIVIGMTYLLVHHFLDYMIAHFIFGCSVLVTWMYLVYQHTRSVHWQFFRLWIKQFKVIILILASLTIFWTDCYWGITMQKSSGILGTVVVNATILFFLWIDLMDMTVFLRASIPSILLIQSALRMFKNRFSDNDIPFWTYQGRVLSILDIQNIAYSQILVLAFLGLKSVVTDKKHKKFYFIEKNEKRGADYITYGWSLFYTDIAFLMTLLLYVCAFRFNAKIVWQVISGIAFVFVGIPYLRDVKLKFSYFLHYRPFLLILATVIILFCDTYRLVHSKTNTWQVEQSINTVVYVYCVVVAILSDFHTGPTKLFRLFVALLMVIQTGVSVYYNLFVVPDVGLITIDNRTLGVNAIERNAYCQVLFLLKSQLVSLIEDPSHSKFFLLPKPYQRGELFERFSTRIETRV